MFGRKRSGAVLCASCGKLVGMQDEVCFNCGRRNPALWGFSPVLRRLGGTLEFTNIVTWGCAAIYVATLLADIRGIGMSGFSILAPSFQGLFAFGASGAIPVFGYGRWWTLLSAGWLHGNLLHIVFNMMWVRQLAPAAAELFGSSRMMILYSASSLAGFAMSTAAGLLFGAVPVPFLRGAQFTVGASAAIFGLLGAMVLYGRRTGSSLVRGQALGYAGIMFVFGLVMPGVDNFAHLGGFLGGYAMAHWLDPMTPEKPGHAVAALALLGLTVLSILVSVV